MFFAICLEATGDLEVFLESKSSAWLVFLVQEVLVGGEVAGAWTNIFCFFILFSFFTVLTKIAASAPHQAALQVPDMYFLDISNQLGYLPPLLQAFLVLRDGPAQEGDEVFIDEIEDELSELFKCDSHW